MQSEVYIVHCEVCSVLCAVCSVQYAVCSVHHASAVSTVGFVDIRNELVKISILGETK